MTEDALPEADRVDGTPHPRATRTLFGHDAAESELLEAATGHRMHHAWLLTGPKGIGKATLAWRMARFLLAGLHTQGDDGLFGAPPAPTTLDVPEDHPVSHRLAALSDPGLLLIRRAWDPDRKRLKGQITVDEVRKLNGFFGLSASDGGRRVVIVDSADEMNTAAANALLKVLEEPPKNAVLLLVSHQPARLLPTIRSRCRELRLGPLSPDALHKALDQAGAAPDQSSRLAELSGGSAGEALQLIGQDGLALYERLIALMTTCPQMDRQALGKLVEHVTARGAETRLALFVDLLELMLGRLARTGAGHPPAVEAADGEAELFRRLAPTPRTAQEWASLHQSLTDRIAHGLGVNIDAQSLLTNALLQINEMAAKTAQ